MLTKTRLNNGLVALNDFDERFHSSSLVICLKGGLLDEKETTAGISHLLEHMLFKRTSSLDTAQIAGRIDELGGDINAFTDADSVCLHGVVPAGILPDLFEFFVELLRAPACTEDDLALEKEVIRQEILEAEDDPTDVAYSRFSKLFWKDSVVGLPVFGTLENVAEFSLADVFNRLKELLVGSRLIIGVSGATPADEFLNLVERHFGDLPKGEEPQSSIGDSYQGYCLIPRPIGQVHFSLGLPWPSLDTDKYIEGVLASSILGGSMSSRFFQLLREQHGLAYDISTDIDAYRGSAALITSGALERENLGTALKLILGEFEKVREDHFSLEEIARLVKSHSAQLEMEIDSNSDRVWRVVESELVHGRTIGSSEIVDRFRSITPGTIAEVLDQYLLLDQFLAVFVGDVVDVVLDPEVISSCGGVQLVSS